MTDPTTAYVVCIVFAATLIRSALGFGEALVAVPLLALRVPVQVAAPPAVGVSVLVAAAYAGLIVTGLVLVWQATSTQKGTYITCNRLNPTHPTRPTLPTHPTFPT